MAASWRLRTPLLARRRGTGRVPRQKGRKVSPGPSRTALTHPRHWRPIPPLRGRKALLLHWRLGKYYLGRLCPEYHQERLLIKLCPAPRSTKAIHLKTAPQRGCGGGPGSHDSRLLQMIVSGPKERWQQQASHPSIELDARDLQDGDDGIHHGFTPPRRVDHINRSQGCVLSCTNCQEFEKVPTLCSQRQSVPVCGSTLRSRTRPIRVHKDHGGGSSLCPYSRGTSTHVSGRLAPPRVLSPGASHWLAPGPMLITRTDSQYSEVKLLPLEGFCLSRNKVPDSPLHLLSLEGLMEEAAGCHQEVP